MIKISLNKLIIFHREGRVQPVFDIVDGALSESNPTPSVTFFALRIKNEYTNLQAHKEKMKKKVPRVGKRLNDSNNGEF